MKISRSLVLEALYLAFAVSNLLLSLVRSILRGALGSQRRHDQWAARKLSSLPSVAVRRLCQYRLGL